MSSLYQKESNIHITKDKFRSRELYADRPRSKNPYLAFDSPRSLVTLQLPVFVQPHIKASRLHHFLGLLFLMRAPMSHKTRIK